MPPSGRERRRTDAYGRARRFVYGILLLAAAPGAIAADGLSDLGKYRATAAAAAAPAQALVATLQGLVMIHAEQVVSPATPLYGHTGYPRMALDTVTARVHEGLEPPRFRVAGGDGRSVRDGVGFDLNVGDVGNFHLNLYARRNAKTGGRRYALNEDREAPDPGAPWSLGGTLELVRTISGERYVTVVPELQLDLSGSETRYLPFQASLKHANWRSVADKASLDERVLQLTFKWRL